MSNPNIVEAGKDTRFPVNRQDHTQKGPYLTSILKKLMAGEWEFDDPKVRALLEKTDCKKTIETALVLRRILNGTEGDDAAIERIFDRIDGKVSQKIENEHSGTVNVMGRVIIDGKPLEINID